MMYVKFLIVQNNLYIDGLKDKIYIRNGTNVYVKTKKGKVGKLYAIWNVTTGKLKQLLHFLHLLKYYFSNK
jgi:hypothetical protein